MTNENNVSNKRGFSTTDKLIIAVLAAWLLFGGGYSWLKSMGTAKNLREVTTTIGTGVQRLADKGQGTSLQPTTGSSTGSSTESAIGSSTTFANDATMLRLPNWYRISGNRTIA
jgi:hypothetical protein